MKEYTYNNCPICNDLKIDNFTNTNSRSYIRCKNCEAIFLDRNFRLTPSEERSRYESHQNNPADLAYRKHLSIAVNPIIELVKKGGSGLDFGSGPGPTASIMLEEAGFKMEIYDPFFANNLGVLNNRYDFIISTETIEHFFYPNKEFELFSKLVKPNGYLSIMTKLFCGDTEQDFITWYYPKDPTHVTFYSFKTVEIICKIWNWELIAISESYFLLQKV